MSVSFDGSELNKLAADLQVGGLRVVKKAGEVVKKATLDTVRDGKAACPVATGRTRRSIGADIIGLTGVAGPTTFWGKYAEEGTSQMAPSAYMGPAQDRNTPAFVDGMADLAKEILR